MHTHTVHTVRPGRCLPLQLDDVISSTRATPTGRHHSPWFVFTGGDCRNTTGASSKAIPAPYSVLIGGEGLQVKVYVRVRKDRGKGKRKTSH